MKRMERIAVTGGKGGVGKSTVAILLAVRLSRKQKVVLIDADVECPNDYLLLGQQLKKPVGKVFAKFPVLDKSKCQHCGLCAEKCRFNAVFAPKGKHPIFVHELCSSCGLCWHICPFGAIKAKKKITGEIFENRINDNLFLITGRTVGIVDETGPVVGSLKKYGLKRAKELGVKTVLTDTAPGTHCSVIQALLDVDRALAVTEPTPLGAHDLKLILKLVEKLKIPAEIVLNQANLGKEQLIEEIAKNIKVGIKYRVPYSKEIVKAYSEGRLDKLDIKKLLL